MRSRLRRLVDRTRRTDPAVAAASAPTTNTPIEASPATPPTVPPATPPTIPPATPPTSGSTPSSATEPRSQRWTVADALTRAGVNVVGYLDKQLGLGDAGREVVGALTDDVVPVAPLAFGASPSPSVDPPFSSGSTIEYRDTLAVVTADQMPTLQDWHPEIFTASDRLIGYCFWELSRLSAAGLAGLHLVDEVWAPTRFVASVFEQVGLVPVHHVPFPVPEPHPSPRERETFEPLVSARERTVFGVTFDYWSVHERKNPIGAVDAFTRAFATDEGPLLVVKTLNAASHPVEHARLLDRVGERPDIVVWDEHLSTADQFAFLAGLDVLVSLHRGEGLGKHLAEAMWLGVPCIATGYSGNLDFMSADCARLVGHEMIDVEGGGSIYPAGTQWADPDLDHAAAAMRELAGDDVVRRRLGAAARTRMAAAPDRAALARTARTLLDI